LNLTQNEIIQKITENPGINPKSLHDKLIEQGFEVNYNTLRRVMSTHKKNIVFVDKKEFDDNDVDAYFKAMQELQRAGEKLNTKQTKAHVNINSDKPICVAFWGDWHEGAIGTDYDMLNKHTELIANTDGLYWIGMGDYKDNYQSHGHVGSQYEQIIQPGMQDLAVQHRIKKVAHNNIALVRGCHDDWDKKQSDKDFVQTLCDITGGVNLWHGGDVFINLEGIEYHVKARHKYKFESSLNTENSMRRIMEMQGEADIACAAHLHTPYKDQKPIMKKLRLIARSGSYKIKDEYGQKLAGYDGMIGVPCAILFPDRKYKIDLWLEDAVKILKYYRSCG
jgi:hypothetical protein